MIRHRRPRNPLVLAAAISVTAIAVFVGAVTVILLQRGAPGAGTETVAGSPLGACGQLPTVAEREVRGMTLTTVRNTDWPSRPGLPPEQAQAEYLGWLDLAQQQGHNAIFVQVKPSGDAFYPTDYAPWSEWLTGNLNDIDPGWDPLEFMVTETHKRNIEFHAWVMPYFGSSTEGAGGDLTKLAPDHPLRAHPEWAVVYPDNNSERLWYNPGIPEARRFIEDAILDMVTRYDIDGVFFDDYFYPYPRPGVEFDDEATYQLYGGGLSRDDWRRSNVNALVRELATRIKETKPWVKFGISPFGIWRNQSNDPAGSDTRGLDAYSAIYADSRTWVREEWVDFIVPQLYWHMGNYPVADYQVLVPWWAQQIQGTRVHLYTAHGDYRIGQSGAWSDPSQIERQLTFNENFPVTGSLHFSASHVRNDVLGAVTRYRDTHYSRPAIPPTMPHLPANPPGPPAITESTVDESGRVTLHWRGSGAPATAWAIYRYGPDATEAELVATMRATGEQASFSDAPGPGGPFSYCVSGLDRSWNEGPASLPAIAG